MQICRKTDIVPVTILPCLDRKATNFKNPITKRRQRSCAMKSHGNADETGEQLEEVDEYMYLGRVLTPGNEMAREIDERITSAWKRFG